MTSRQLAAACAALPLALVAASSQPPRDRPLPPAAGARFAISFPAARSAAPLDGRVLLMLSTDTTAEPRFQISDGPTDRKSTRLNSSHLVISYAVFCLKKKITPGARDPERVIDVLDDKIETA